jgi:hypothetical protein
MATANASRGRDLVQRLRDGRAQAGHAPLPGARDLPVLTGLTPQCIFLEPLENVRDRATRILVDSGRVYAYGDDILYERIDGPVRCLVPLTRGRVVERSAAAIMANLVICELAAPDKAPVQFVPPRPCVELLLNSAPTRQAVPRIKAYATRPVFDDDYKLLGPGWHPEAGVLVHGPDVEPILPNVVAPDRPLCDRLPHHLRVLLGDFCLRSDADLANAVGALLTGLLMVQFVDIGKAVVLLDGNQPGVGKTLLARVAGIVLDGIDPQVIHFTTDDEELAKRICATLRGSTQSIVLIDNAKVKAGGSVSSPVIEANSMASQVSLRILGVSSNYVRPNDLLWFLTMNDTKTSPDLVSRGLPIRFWYEGNPGERNFQDRDPLAYAREHRTEILGELAGMVVVWNQAGRPRGTRRHRCDRWARVIGGILESAGWPEFLGNLDEAAASFNEALDELAALAEAAAAAGGPAVFVKAHQDPVGVRLMKASKHEAEFGLSPSKWEDMFRRAKVQVEALDAARSERARATLLGNFLSQNLGREVPIEVKGRTGKARLLAVNAGKKMRRYWFELTWDEEQPADVRQEPVPDAEPITPTRNGAADPPARRPQAEGRANQPVSAAASRPRPGASGAGNEEDWS